MASVTALQAGIGQDTNRRGKVTGLPGGHGERGVEECDRLCAAVCSHRMMHPPEPLLWLGYRGLHLHKRQALQRHGGAAMAHSASRGVP